MGVQDPLGLPGGAGGVVELGRVVGRGVDRVVAHRGLLERRGEVDVARLALASVRRVEHEDHLRQPVGDAVAVLRVGHEHLGAGVAQPVLDALVPVEHGHREEDRARLVGAEEDRRGLGQRRQQRGHAIAALHPVRLEGVGELRGEVLQLAECHLALVAAPVLPEHRHPVTRVLVAHIRGDVVTRGNLPAVLIAHIPVAAQPVLSVAHRSSSPRAAAPSWRRPSRMDPRTFIPPPQLKLAPLPAVGDPAPSAPPLGPLRGPAVVAFLRHVGCPFAESTVRAMTEVADLHPEIRWIVVSHASLAATDRWCAEVRAGLRLELVIDERRELYAAWGLGRSSLAHFAGPRSLASVARLRRRGIGQPSPGGQPLAAGGHVRDRLARRDLLASPAGARRRPAGLRRGRRGRRHLSVSDHPPS